MPLAGIRQLTQIFFALRTFAFVEQTPSYTRGSTPLTSACPEVGTKTTFLLSFNQVLEGSSQNGLKVRRLEGDRGECDRLCQELLAAAFF